MLIALFSWVAAWSQPVLTLRAEVSDDLRSLRGTLVVSGLPADAVWVDPLRSLGVPSHELDVIRTFPDAPNEGAVRWTEQDGVLSFTADLPERFGDTGWSRHGLFANGGWYPQPLVDGGLPIVTWQVQLVLPEGAIGAIGDVVGAGALSWTGEAERASLAVRHKGTLTALSGPGWDLTLLTRSRARPALVRALGNQLSLARPDGEAWRGALVEAPLRRRLGRAGAGLGYVSDRAWRLFPIFKRRHHLGGLGGLLASWQPSPDPYVRALTAAAITQVHADRLARREAVDLLGLTRWIPAVDAALYDQEMAFQAELLQRVHPTDRVRDDLAERLAPHAPAAAVLAQLRDELGPEPVRALGKLLGAGWPLDRAAAEAGVPIEALERWRAPYPSSQDYTIDLSGQTVTVQRDAPADAPPETIVLQVDGERHVLQTSAGPDQLLLELHARPRRVVLDPDRHLDQATRLGEVRPPPLRWTLSGQISGINASERFVTAFAVLTVRRADDTHNRWRLSAFTNQRDRLAGRLTYTRSLGPLIRGATRAHAISLSADAAWLNPRFTDLPGADYTLGGTLSYAWDNRVYSLFPLDGMQVAFAASAGGAPSTGQTFARLRGGITLQKSASPRHVFATQLSAGAAFTDIPARRLDFGGVGGIRGLPDALVQTNVQGVLSTEYRAVPLRNLSVPLLGLAYLTEVQLTGGLDLGVGSADGDTLAALGATVGVAFVADVFGLIPSAVHLTFGAPIWTTGIELPDRALPVEIYLGWGQTF